jgi:hypothetical protein
MVVFPMISRPLVGRDLLNRATLLIQSGSSDTPNYPYRMDTC